MVYTTLDGVSCDMARDYSTPGNRLKDGSVSTPNSRVEPGFRTLLLLGGHFDPKLWTLEGWLAVLVAFGESDLRLASYIGSLRVTASETKKGRTSNAPTDS
jgi:hypothetical protein